MLESHTKCTMLDRSEISDILSGYPSPIAVVSCLSRGKIHDTFWTLDKNSRLRLVWAQTEPTEKAYDILQDH